MAGPMEAADLVVIGSGGGAMTAALAAAHEGLRPLLLEKTEYYGGSTALSGGGMWVPNNYLLAREGIADSLDAARSYMAATVGNRRPRSLQDTYLVNAPRMVEFLRDHSHLELVRMPGYSDYYPERPGGMAQGRGLEAAPFDGRRLGSDLAGLRPQNMDIPAGLAFTATEFRALTVVRTTWQGKAMALKVGGRMLWNLATGTKCLTMGLALIARLRLSLRDAGIELRLRSPLVELVVEGDRVVGVVAEVEGQRRTIRATRGVVLAAGGFEHDAAMRAHYQRPPIGTAWTMGCPGNTGDAIRAGMAIGGAIDLMDDAWWGPSTLRPEGPLFHVNERSLPGAILVDATGQRFTNEAASYVAVVHAMYARHGEHTPCIPAHFIMDQSFRSRYAFGFLPPGRRIPKEYRGTGYVKSAGSLAELARMIGVDAAGLARTVERMNAMARSGKDLDFCRGDSAYDRYYGDPANRPNPCLAPLEKPPFYAVQMWPGDIGTKGGLVTDEHARVLRDDGSVIEGLYAVGNTSASVMGNTYPGPGATIGPAMTFGWLAARHAAGRREPG